MPNYLLFYIYIISGDFSEGYFTFWAIIAIAWGTIGSAVIIVLPLTESRKTIQRVILGMFTNDRLMEKIEELNSKLERIITAMPESEKMAKKKDASEVLDIQISPY